MYERQKRIYVDTMIKYVVSLEEKIKKEKKLWLNEQAIRLGRLVFQRNGSKFSEIWEEGDAFRKIRGRLVSSTI
jgi:hypothetical protein